MGLIVAASFLLAAPPIPAPPKTQRELTEVLKSFVKDSRASAEKGLTILEELVTEENAKSLGFTVKKEVKSAKLGVPFPIVLVRLDELKKYKEGDKPLALLHPIHKVIYPLVVEGEFRSRLEVHAKDGKWEAGSFGLANEVRRYAQVRQKHAGDEKKRTYFLVKVPALNHYYLGHQTEEGLRLIHVSAALEGQLKSQPAGEVFLKLVTFAKEHDGKSR